VANSSANISVLKERPCLDNLFLFKPHSYWLYHWSGSLAEIPFNVSLSVMGRMLVSLNSSSGEVTSTLPYSDELIRNATHSTQFRQGIRKLHLQGTSLNVSTLTSLSSSLEVLQLDSVELQGLGEGQRVSQLLTNFSHLEELSLKFGPFLEVSQNTGSTSRPPPLILLDDLPTTLKTLTLSHVQLSLNPASTVNFHLEALSLYRTEILSEALISNFGRHFQVGRVAWEVEGVSGAGQPKVATKWADILEKLSAGNPEWVFLDNSHIGGFLSNGAAPLRPSEFVLGLHLSHTVLTSRAANFTYKRRGERGEVSARAEPTPKALWFNLLHVQTFLERRLMNETFW